MALSATLYSDPACPWGYSANPALAALHWRYGDQLEWRLVTIGLTEHAEQYVSRGYTPERAALGYMRFRRFGMPFSTAPKERIAGTSRACRAVVATRLRQPELEYQAFRALQFAWFTTPLVLDDEADIMRALAEVPGLDAGEIVGALDDPAVTAAYEADRAESRTADGSPTEFQGKAANSDGKVRYTAPSVVFAGERGRLEAGGFQPVEAYDVLIANLDPTLSRAPAAEDPRAVLERFPYGLTTQEIAAIMTAGNDPVDRSAAEAALVGLVAGGGAERLPLGDDALWLPRAGRLPAAA